MKHLIGRALLTGLLGATAAFAGGSQSEQSSADVQQSYKELPNGYEKTVKTTDTKPSVRVTVEQKNWKKWQEARNRELARLRSENQSLKTQMSQLQNEQSLKGVADVRQDERGLILTLTGGVLFTSGSAELLPDAQKRLDTVAEVLAQAPGATFTVEGHTDSQGSVEYNKELSQQRADAVKDYLVTKGVNGDNIEAVGHGEERAIASNDSPEGRANNRRVEVVLPEGSLGIGGSGQSGEGGAGESGSSESTGEGSKLDDDSDMTP